MFDDPKTINTILYLFVHKQTPWRMNLSSSSSSFSAFLFIIITSRRFCLRQLFLHALPATGFCSWGPGRAARRTMSPWSSSASVWLLLPQAAPPEATCRCCSLWHCALSGPASSYLTCRGRGRQLNSGGAWSFSLHGASPSWPRRRPRTKGALGWLRQWHRRRVPSRRAADTVIICFHRATIWVETANFPSTSNFMHLLFNFLSCQAHSTLIFF